MDDLFQFERENQNDTQITSEINTPQCEDITYLLWLSEVDDTTDLKLTDKEAMEVICVKRAIISYINNPNNRSILLNEVKMGSEISTMIKAIFNTISQQKTIDEIEQILTCVLFVNSFDLSRQQIEELIKALRLNEMFKFDFNQTNVNEDDYLRLTNEMAASHFRQYLQLKHIGINDNMSLYQAVLPKIFVGDAILNEVIYHALNELKYENLLQCVRESVKATIDCDDGCQEDSDMDLDCDCISLDKINMLEIQKLGIQILLPSRLINPQISPLSVLDFYLDCYNCSADKKTIYNIVHFEDYKTLSTIDQFMQKINLHLQDLDLDVISHQFRYIFTELLLFYLKTFTTRKFKHFNVTTLPQWDPFIKGNFYTTHNRILFHSKDIIRLMLATLNHGVI
jgi:hypothetical protein